MHPLKKKIKHYNDYSNHQDTSIPFKSMNQLCTQMHSKSQQKYTLLNLSSHHINDATVNTLKKDLGFAIAPRHIPVEDIVYSIEDTIKYLPDDIKDEIRQDLATSLRHAKPLKINLRKHILIALKNIRKNDSIVVLKVDKGGAIVILGRQDYENKMLKHLSSSGSYKKLSNNPLRKITMEVKRAIKLSLLGE